MEWMMMRMGDDDAVADDEFKMSEVGSGWATVDVEWANSKQTKCISTTRRRINNFFLCFLHFSFQSPFSHFLLFLVFPPSLARSSRGTSLLEKKNEKNVKKFI